MAPRDTRDITIQNQSNISNLVEEVNGIRQDLNEVKKNLNEINSLLQQAKGARWIIYIMFALGGFVISKWSFFISFFTTR